MKYRPKAPARLWLLAAAALFCLPASALAMDFVWIGKFRQDFFDLTSQNISPAFKKFMRCNAGILPFGACSTDADASLLLSAGN